MPFTRQQICQTSSRKLAAAIPTLGQTRAVLGFDGFVDEIIGVVDKRHDAASYASIQTIASFQEKSLPPSGNRAIMN